MGIQSPMRRSAGLRDHPPRPPLRKGGTKSGACTPELSPPCEGGVGGGDRDKALSLCNATVTRSRNASSERRPSNPLRRREDTIS